MKKFFFTCCALLLCMCAIGQPFQSAVNSAQVNTIAFNAPIHQLRIYGNSIFVSSDHGISGYSLTDNEGWQNFYDGDVAVYDFVKSGNLFLTTNVRRLRLHQNPLHSQRLYKCKMPDTYDMFVELLSSDDFGATWHPTGKFSGEVSLAFNLQNEANAVAYGLNMFVDCICPFVSFTTDNMSTWEETDFLVDDDGMVEDDDRMYPEVNSMAFSPTAEGEMVAGMGYGMAFSEDGGHSWRFSSVGFPGFQFSNAVFDDLHPDIVYACGSPFPGKYEEWKQQAMVFRSDNGGRSWNAIYYIPREFAKEIGAIGGMTCHQGRLYLWVGSSIMVLTEPQSMIPVNNGTNAIGNGMTLSGAKETGANATFDLQGRKVRGTKMQKGIYIRKGRKMLNP